MLCRIAWFAILSCLLVCTSGWVRSSRGKSESVTAGNDKQDVSVTIKGDNRRELIPVKHEIVDLSKIKEAPPIPNGYKLSGNLAFQINSEPIDGIASSPYIVTVKFLNAISERDFNRLRILSLDVDNLSPTHWSWLDSTVLAQRLKFISPTSSQAKFPEALPNFAEKTISARVDWYKCFAIVLEENTPNQSVQPFTRIEVKTDYSSKHIKVGDKLNITVTISNQGPRPAEEVTFDFNLDDSAELLSVSSPQGTQSQSIVHGRNTVFHLGAVAVGASVKVTLEIAAPNSIPENLNANVPATKKKPQALANTISILYKERSKDIGGVRDMLISDMDVFPR